MAESGDKSSTQQEVKFLLAIDNSEFAEYAFKYYFENLYNRNATLVLVHCTESPYLVASLSVAGGGHGGALNDGHLESVIRAKKLEVERIKEFYLKKLDKFPFKVNYKFRIKEHTSDPGHVIIKTAEEEKVDLIIVGTRGRGLIRRTILGSTSDFILHHSKVPVLICHKEDYDSKKSGKTSH